MADELSYAIVCPSQKVAEGNARMITIPGTDGEFGVLAGHAPFLTTVGAGFVQIENANGHVEEVHVRGGFAEVTKAGLSLVVEGALKLSDMDRGGVQVRINQLSELIAEAGEDHARAAPLVSERAALDAVLSKL